MPEKVSVYDPNSNVVIGEYQSGKVDINIEPYGFIMIV